ncbi:GNAT family N-acetyltransferase [Romboutsia sp.]|uniref:GNAT family N-acetyltransferase n=1 Tax=Romboutsia sp. TaxID=1965302 RepID=UPI003F3AE23C
MILAKDIKLRALNSEDKVKILSWANDPDIKILTGGIFPVSEIEHQRWFESRVVEPINKTFGIETNENSEIIGIIGLKETDLINRSSELYIYIGNKQYWGKGYGTQAVSRLVEFCFDELNLNRICLYVFDYNERAIASYKKVGFKVEGILRQSLYKKGKYHNKVLMSVLREDLK